MAQINDALQYTIIAPGLVYFKYNDFIGIPDKLQKKIKSLLTTIEIPQPGRPKHARLRRYKALIYDKGYIIPRVTLLKIKNFIKIKKDPNATHFALEEGRVVEYSSEVPVYKYQQIVIDAIMLQFARPISPPFYLQMEVGLGKTRVGCVISKYVGKPTLLVAPSNKNIADSWFDTMTELYPEIRVRKFNNQQKKPPTFYNCDFIIVIINTFYKKEPDFLKGCGLIIFDEAHSYSSPEFGKALWLAQHVPKIMGLSATPNDAPDGLERHVYNFLGDPINAEDLEGFDEKSDNFKCHVTKIKYTCKDPQYCVDDVHIMHTIATICKDPIRNQMLIDELKRLSNMKLIDNQRHGIFIFAEHKDFLPIVREQIINAGFGVETPELDENVEEFIEEDFAPNDDSFEVGTIKVDHNYDLAAAEQLNVSLLRGGVKKNTVKSAANARIILVTYAYGKQGISFQHMTASIYWTPRRNKHKQIWGRIRRKGSDERILREIVDLIDMSINLKNQQYTRDEVYLKNHFSISIYNR